MLIDTVIKNQATSTYICNFCKGGACILYKKLFIKKENYLRKLSRNFFNILDQG